jgi:hypothetical protein
LLEGLRDQGKLVCRQITPYREHLAQHFFAHRPAVVTYASCTAGRLIHPARVHT